MPADENEMKPWEGIKAFEPEGARGNVICSELLGGNQLIHQRHFGSCIWLIYKDFKFDDSKFIGSACRSHLPEQKA